ncbi:MAG: PhnA domain-containing protein [Chitinophagales bacterium]
MSLEKELQARSGGKCELCTNEDNLVAYIIPPSTEGVLKNAIHACEKCRIELDGNATADLNHWRCLNDSMWSTEPAVQVVAYRMLDRLKSEGWPQDLLDMMYLDDETLNWAKETIKEDNGIIHKDSNGVILQNGDTVVLTQTLNVKGSSVAAKRGTAVRKIRLVHDNAEHIEGKVEGQQIVILTKFVKKSS